MKELNEIKNITDIFIKKADAFIAKQKNKGTKIKYTITPSEQKVIPFAKLRKIAKILSDEPCDIYAVNRGNSYVLDFCYGKDKQ